MKRFIMIMLIANWALNPRCQTLLTMSDYLHINAVASDPLYTVYSATMARSDATFDIAYRMDYYNEDKPVSYSDNKSGKMFTIWDIDGKLICAKGEFHVKPVVDYSFPDMMVMHYQPTRGIQVSETFLVYSSSMAVVGMEIRNTDSIAHEVKVFPVFMTAEDSIYGSVFNENAGGYNLSRTEGLNAESGQGIPAPALTRDIFASSRKITWHCEYKGTPEGFLNLLKNSGKINEDSLKVNPGGMVNLLSLQVKKRLWPGETFDLRYMHGSQPIANISDSLISEASLLKTTFLKTYFEDNLLLFGRIPRIDFHNKTEKILYLGSFNLIRGCMLPASGETKYNHFSLSRQISSVDPVRKDVPIGIVSYAYLDPRSAQASMREYVNQPFFCMTSLEVFRITKDKQYLAEAFESASKAVNQHIKGSEGILAGKSADIALTIIIEEKSIAKMAAILGKSADAHFWQNQADNTAKEFAEMHWDVSTMFLGLMAGIIPKEKASKQIFYGSSLNYLVYKGLKQYGLDEEAIKIATGIKLRVSERLSRDHNFLDSANAGNNPGKNSEDYLMESIMARLLIEENQGITGN